MNAGFGLLGIQNNEIGKEQLAALIGLFVDVT
jgi:hypothetical protein